MSERTKRRKVKEEIDVINNCINTQLDHVYKINDNVEKYVDQQKPNSTLSILSKENITSTSCLNVPTNNTIDKSTSTSFDFTRHNNTTCSETVDTLDTLSTVNLSSTNLSSFPHNLANWAINCNVSLTTVNSLLCVLKSFEGVPIPALPKDARTLLQTPYKLNTHYRVVEPGLYFHFGLAAGIHQFVNNSPGINVNEFNIAIGIDGLPLAKSSGSQFYPILAYIIEPFKNKYVFLVGLYHGYEKPKNSDDFLSDFVSEMINISQNGIDINGKKV